MSGCLFRYWVGEERAGCKGESMITWGLVVGYSGMEMKLGGLVRIEWLGWEYL